MGDIWDIISNDVKKAVNTVYYPFDIYTKANKRGKSIHYYPPYFLGDNRCEFFVWMKNCGIIECEDDCDLCIKDPEYPLTCGSPIFNGFFIVKSSGDWINHVCKFIPDIPRVKKLIKIELRL